MISKIIEGFKSLMIPHDRMIKGLEEKRMVQKAQISEVSIIQSLSDKDIEDLVGKPEELAGYGINQSFRQSGSDVISPVPFLGENHGVPFYWTNKEDMFVNFQILDSVVMTDVEFFLRYAGEDADGMCAPLPLSAEEKKKYPLHIFPCFTEVAEVVNAQMTKPLQYLNADQECFIVAHENVLGLLVFGNTDTIDVARRSIGFEDKDQLHYQIQFMRFDQAAIARMGLAQEPAEYCRQMRSKGFPTLRVNFAKYNNE